MREDNNIRQTYLIGTNGSITQGDDIDPFNEDQYVVKTTKKSPFDFVNAITYNKQDLFEIDPNTLERCQYSDSEYPKFIINRALSYYPDTILLANAANMMLNNTPNSSHFDFYRLSVERKKRFAKWGKPVDNDDVELISRHYNINRRKALDALSLLTQDDLKQLHQLYEHGGKRK